MHRRSRWIPPLLGGLFLARASFGEPSVAVVFVEPQSEQLDRTLRDALTAQLSGGPVELVFDHFADAQASLPRRMMEARALARSHKARGVFWIDAQPGNDWLLYLAEPSGERTLVRRIEIEANTDDAAVEAVAVITRQSSEALLSGGTVGMQPVPAPPRPENPEPPDIEPQPQPPPRPAPPRLRFRGLAISAAYAGDLPAKRIGWQSGIAVAAAYHFDDGPYAALGYTFFRDAEVDTSGIDLRITRNPVYVEGGWAFGDGPFLPSVAARATLDVLSRHAVSTNGAFAGTPDAIRPLVLLSPRVRADYALSPTLAVYGAVGADFGLNRFSFVSRVAGGDRVLLELNLVRPSVEVGLSFWP